MKIAYLINQYPLISHTFIRREIQALEAIGTEVVRVSIRPGDVLDAADQPESQKTRTLLSVGALGLLLGTLAALVAKPLGFCRVLGAALRCGFKSHRGVLRHLVYLAEALTLARWLRKENTSHIHAHFGTNSATVAMLACRYADLTYSFTIHGPEEFDQPVALSLPEKITRAAFVVAISHFGQSQVFRWCPYDQWHKVHVVRCTVDPAYLDTTPQTLPTEPNLVCVGRLGPEKGQERMVEACALLRDRGVDFHLTLVGGGVFTDRTQQLIDSLNLTDRITITGWVDQQRVRDEINRAKIMAMPTFAEGLPVVFMESLAMGRPVLSTYVAGIPELVVPDDTGWLIPAGSVEAIAGAIEQALATPQDTLERMGAAGRERTAAMHNAATEAAKLQALFNQLA